MATTRAVLHVRPEFFDSRERELVEAGGLSASAFRFDSGVCGLRLRNDVGEIVMLPFQGQQIWSACFHGRDLTMGSMFSQPVATDSYLDTYGGFLLHCGATAMGVPTAEDNHPLHGELPDAPFQKAWIVLGEDEQGAYIGVGGEYRHTVAFNHNYVALPQVLLRPGSGMLATTMTIRNLKNTPMEWMYLAHINFRPVDQGRLVYSAHCTPEKVRVRRSIPSHVVPGPGYREFLEALAQEPAKHNVIRPDLQFDPEVCFFIDYEKDADGFAHSLQVHPDGTADYVRHRPEELDKGIRWICRTADQQAMGLVLPATAEPEGYHAEKAKGNVRVIPARGSVTFGYDMGMIPAPQAQQVAARIDRILEA